MKSLMGLMSREMLERYSHIRMAAKRTAVEAAFNAESGFTFKWRLYNFRYTRRKTPHKLRY